MAGFRIQLFKGIRPRISALKLQAGEAQTAQNSRLGSGDLRAWDEKDSGVAVDDTWYNRTVYLFDNAGTPRWFQWNTYVDVARGPIKDDSIERTYFTGDGVPKMTYTTIADSAATGPYPEADRDLGIPAPPNPISIPSSALPENVSAEDRNFSSITFDVLILDVVTFTVYPGTGVDNQTWRLGTYGYFGGAARSVLAFSVNKDEAFRVKRVINDTKVVLESAANPGVFLKAENPAAWDGNPATANYAMTVLMEEQGSTKKSQWTGISIPEATVTFAGKGHNLSEGDAIRITAGLSEGGPFPGNSAGVMEFVIETTTDFYEQSWDAEAEEPVNWGASGNTAYIIRSARVAAAATEGTATFSLAGTYTYDVSRGESEEAELDDRQYVYTYVSELGEEGPPSSVSGTIDTLSGKAVVLTGFQNVFTDPNLDNRVIDFFRIYRTNSSEAGTEFQFVGEVGTGTAALPTTKFVDTVDDAELAEALDTTTWFPPDSAMQGIITLPNGVLAGFSGKTVFLSEPYFPHAWPPEYDQAVNYDVVGIANIGNSVVVMTDGHPYIITGAHPRSMNIRPIRLNQASMNRQSIASDGDKVYYASPDGLVEISVNGARLVTESYVEKKEWAAFAPNTMVGEFHDGKYFGFHGAVGDTGTGAESGVTQPPVTVVLSGTMITADEDDIQAGGQVLDITITGETWAASGATFNAQRQNIIDSLVSDLSETNGWNAERSNVPVTDVTRQSNTLARITLTALANFEISVEETLTMTLPPTVFASATADNIIVSQTFPIATADNFSSRLIYVTDTGRYGVSGGDADSWDTGTIDIDGDTLTVTSSPAAGAQHIAYDTLRSRWVIAVGDVTPVTKPVMYTSDTDGVSWVRREVFENAYQVSGQVINHLNYYPEYDLMLGSFGQVTPLVNGTSAVYSKDGGTNWRKTTIDSVGGHEMASGETGFDTLNGSFFIPAFKDATTDAKLVVQAAATPGDNWAVETINVSGSPLDILDTVVTGNGKAVYAWLSGVDNDIELGYYDPGAGTHTSIGVITNSGATALFSAFGNGSFMVMQTNSAFTLVAADDSETTIGNWSAMSTPTANFLVHNLYYDGGDGVTAGWGWVACGTNTSSSKGVIYTSSDDGATWVLQQTTSANAVILSCAFDNYTTDLEKA